MKIVMFPLLFGLIIGYVTASKTPCWNELAAIEAYLKVITSQNNGVGPFGNEKPDCLRDGTYAPLQCHGGSCHCKSADGIQMSENFDIGLSDKSSCLCIRYAQEFYETITFGQGFECTATGSFDPIQCTGTECFCVNWEGNRRGTGSVNLLFIDQLNCSDGYY